LTEQPGHAEQFDALMLEQTAREAQAEIEHVRLRDVFDYRPLFRKLLVAAGVVLSFAFFYAWNQPAVATCINRIYLLKNEPWPRKARIEVVGVEVLGPEDGAAPSAELPLVVFRDGALKVAKGSNLRLKVRADIGAEKVPKVCVVHYKTSEGDRGRVTMNRMRRTAGKYQNYSFANKPLRGILSTVYFDVVGYDCRVRDLTIEVVDSPTIVSTQLDCVFPDYMVDEANSQWLPQTIEWTGATQLPRGTEFTIRAKTNKPLKRVDLFNVETEETTQLTIDAADDASRGFEFHVDRLDDNLTLDVTLFDVDDVVTDRPQRIFIAAVEDEPPRVDVQLRGIGTAVTPDVRIPVTGTVTDDYGVGRTWFDADITLNASTEDQQVSEHRELNFALGAAASVEAAIDFRELRSELDGLELKPKDQIVLAIRGEDRYDLGEAPNQSSSERYQLDVVSPDTLLAMLESREIGLRRRFEQIIDETTQARDFLVRVKSPATDLGPEPADSPGDGDEPGDAKLDERKAAERAQSLRLLRVQQALQQTRKSAQELMGVATSFLDIREEIINNRVDTEDRKTRLKDLIADPMRAIGEEMFPELEQFSVDLEKVLLDDLNAGRYDLDIGQPQAESAADQADLVLAAMEEILQQMLDLETFNELLDIVRQLQKDQQKLIDDTQAEREKGLLEELQGLQDLQ
jgi:hypothetical protein